MNRIRDFILNNGGQIKELPYGKEFTTWNGKNVKGKKYKVAISFNGLATIDLNFQSIVRRFENKGILNVLALGYSHCTKCSGTGRVNSYKHIENGLCFKCNGSGYVDDIKTNN